MKTYSAILVQSNTSTVTFFFFPFDFNQISFMEDQLQVPESKRSRCERSGRIWCLVLVFFTCGTKSEIFCFYPAFHPLFSRSVFASPHNFSCHCGCCPLQRENWSYQWTSALHIFRLEKQQNVWENSANWISETRSSWAFFTHTIRPHLSETLHVSIYF